MWVLKLRVWGFGLGVSGLGIIYSEVPVLDSPYLRGPEGV